MIALDSPRWTQLDGAFGKASESATAPLAWDRFLGFLEENYVPSILECLQWFDKAVTTQNIDPMEMELVWDCLFDSLCHQGTIYPASLAAVPHIIYFGERFSLVFPGKLIHKGFFELPTGIELVRLEKKERKFDTDVLDAYFSALPGLQNLAFQMVTLDWPDGYGCAVLSALALSKNQVFLAKLLSDGCDAETVEELIRLRFNTK